MELAREPNFRLGGMEVRPSTREIVHESGRDVLEPRVMAVLVVLAHAKGEVVTRDDLTNACWDGRVVSDDAINRVISRIRRTSDLTDGKDFTLETITKVGYRLVAAAPAAETVEAAPIVGPAETAGKRPPLAMIGALAVLVVLVATGAWWLAGREPDWKPDPTRSLTLAVLPFDNLGTSHEDEQLAMGMSREIRNTLSRVRGLRVVSDASSFALASEPLGEIRNRLHADLLLDGSLTRTGDRIKLSAELVDGWTGVNVWTGSQAGSANDLERLRQEMSASVFEQLVVRLGPNRLEKLAEPKPSDPQVYRLLVQASSVMDAVTRARMRGEAEAAIAANEEAGRLIDQALAIDPESAPALRLKALQLVRDVRVAAGTSAQTLVERETQYAEYLRRALASDPDNVSALGTLGEYYRRYVWRWTEAKALLERAIALDPNDSDVRLSYGYYLSTTGNCVGALEQFRVAIEIDPEFGWRTLGVPRALKCLGRFEESDAAYRQALAQDPKNFFVLREVYLNFLERRDPDGLKAFCRYVRDELWGGKPDEQLLAWLNWTDAAARALRGDGREFAALIEKDVRADASASASAGAVSSALPPPDINRRRGDIMWIRALEFAVAGEPKRAVDMLEQALAFGSLYIPETMPYGASEFSPEVRADPRYRAIWRTDPRLVELAKMRLEALQAGRMMGVLPDGTMFTPPVPGKLVVDSRS